jgi:hypothetical protein
MEIEYCSAWRLTKEKEITFIPRKCSSQVGEQGLCLSCFLSRAAHRRIYSFFTALRAPSFHTYLYQNTPHSTSTAYPGRDTSALESEALTEPTKSMRKHKLVNRGSTSH